MSEPKKMNNARYARHNTRCVICAKEVSPGDLYYTTKNRGRPLRHIHAGCWTELKKVKA